MSSQGNSLEWIEVLFLTATHIVNSTNAAPQGRRCPTMADEYRATAEKTNEAHARGSCLTAACGDPNHQHMGKMPTHYRHPLWVPNGSNIHSKVAGHRRTSKVRLTAYRAVFA